MISVTFTIETAKEPFCAIQGNSFKHEKQVRCQKPKMLDLFPQNFTANDAIDLNLNMVSNTLAHSVLHIKSNTLIVLPFPLSMIYLN